MMTYHLFSGMYKMGLHITMKNLLGVLIGTKLANKPRKRGVTTDANRMI